MHTYVFQIKLAYFISKISLKCGSVCTVHLYIKRSYLYMFPYSGLVVHIVSLLFAEALKSMPLKLVSPLQLSGTK